MRYAFIGLFYRYLVKSWLFLFDPELIHDRFTSLGYALGKHRFTRWATEKIFAYQDTRLQQTICGIEFANPVGLSAGFDKDANLQNILGQVGFGFTQIGSVTLNAYTGNPRPRLFRLKKSLGLVVYYGLKNMGAAQIISKLSNTKPTIPISISIAKTNASYTASESAGINDYVECLKQFNDHQIGDFYTINISCPNTFGGEPFTTPEKLERLLQNIDKLKVQPPIFIKMPINLTWIEFKELLDVALQHNVAGVVIGNLTKIRDPQLIHDYIPENIQGGISGMPTQKLCNDLISQTYAYCGDKLVIIGVGGIFSAQDAYEKIKRGATLVQLITGMIFRGPQLIGQINHDLVKLLADDGYTHISEAVGVYQKQG